MTARRLLGALVSLFAAAGGLLFVWSAPALAQREHVFSSSFGSAGSGNGQLSQPGALAVNEESGDVYVIDRGNDRVEIFSPAGDYVGQFDGSASPSGAFSWPATSEASEGSIAVDNSTSPLDPSRGDVYVLDTGHHVVDKFSSSGAYLGQVVGPSPSAPFEPLTGAGSAGGSGSAASLSVDSGGALWVELSNDSSGGQFDQFNDALANEYMSKTEVVFPFVVGSPSAFFGSAVGFALDSEDNIYTGRNFHANGPPTVPAEFTKTGQVLDEELDGEALTAFATDLSSNDVYVDHEASVAAYGPSHGLVERFGAGRMHASAGIAVDSATGAVYTADASNQEIDVFSAFIVSDVTTDSASNFGETSVTVGGVVDPDGLPITACVFEYGTEPSYGSSEPCTQTPAQIGSGNGPVAVSASLSGLARLTGYHFRLKVSNANGANVGGDHTFVTPEPVALSAESVSEVSSDSAQFSAHVDPGGADTTFAFEYGTSVSYGQSVPVPAGDLGAGASSVPVVVHAQGLLADTTYHVRVVASNVLGTVYGPDETFTTQGAGGLFALPDGRVWELVSPPIKNGASVDLKGVTEAAVDGGAIVYGTSGPVANPAGNPSPTGVSEVLSRREASGWSSEDIATPHAAATETSNVEYHFFSPDLSRALIEPAGGTPLSPVATEKTLYVRNDLECNQMAGEAISATCYTPLVTPQDVPPGTRFGPVQGAANNRPLIAVLGTPDLSHVLFLSDQQLTDDAPEVEGNDAENIYEWSGGQLQLVNILPDGAASIRGALGVKTGDMRHVISSDGSRIFWTQGTDENEHWGQLYMRDTVTGQTLRLDAPDPGVLSSDNGEAPGEGAARFQVANADGSNVFFLDAKPLTPDSKLEPTAEAHVVGDINDLYECHIVEEAGKLKCDLTDLSVDRNAGEQANVQDLVLGASEDGAWVYFVADGVLGDGAEHGATPGHCVDNASPGAEPPGATCNLYVEHYDGSEWSPPRFIAALSAGDINSWGGGGEENSPIMMTSTVSPDGRYLAFMSDRSLTGYDNRDANSGQLDEEVFLYHAEISGSEQLEPGRLVCASCDPTGARPAGRFEEGTEGSEGSSLVDAPGLWNGRWIAANIPGWMQINIQFTKSSGYQWRYLSNEGRLFFDSADALVAQDTNGTEDVYEYEPPAAGESADGDSCTVTSATYNERSNGCMSLISSGTSGEESAFLDASESGNDVFFVTAARLASQDVDTSLDVYDAHVCSSAAPCTRVPTSPPPCTDGETCKAAPSPQPALFGAPSSATFVGAGNSTPSAPVPAVTPKRSTRAQELAAALNRCRQKPRKRRVLCESQARKRYGTNRSKSGKRASAGKRVSVKGRR